MVASTTGEKLDARRRDRRWVIVLSTLIGFALIAVVVFALDPTSHYSILDRPATEADHDAALRNPYDIAKWVDLDSARLVGRSDDAEYFIARSADGSAICAVMEAPEGAGSSCLSPQQLNSVGGVVLGYQVGGHGSTMCLLVLLPDHARLESVSGGMIVAQGSNLVAIRAPRSETMTVRYWIGWRRIEHVIPGRTDRPR